MKKRQRIHSYIYLLISTIAWGALLPIVKYGFDHSALTPYHYLLYRFSLAAILTLPYIIKTLPTMKHLSRSLPRITLIETLGTSIALGFLYVGLYQTSALAINLLGTALPVFVILGGIFFLHEREEKHEWQGVVLAVVGTLVLLVSSLSSNTHTQTTIFGLLCIMLYNIATVAYTLLAKKHYHPYPKLFITSVSFWIGAFTFLVVSFIDDGYSVRTLFTHIKDDLTNSYSLFTVFYAAIFGSIIGATAFIKGQDGIESSESALFSYIQPIIYIPLGYFLLGEQASLFELAALLLILYGVYVAEKRKS